MIFFCNLDIEEEGLLGLDKKGLLAKFISPECKE